MEDSYNGISIGDIVKGYHAGYHVVTGFHWGSFAGNVLQVEYTTILTNNGKRTTKKSGCALGYCTKVDKKFVLEQYEAELAEINHKRDTILAVLKEICGV